MIYFDKDNLHTDQYGKINFSKIRGTGHDIAFYRAKGKFGSIDIKEIKENEFDICEFSLDTSVALDITSQCRDGLGLTIPVKRNLKYSIKDLDDELSLLRYNIIYTPRPVKGSYTFPKGRYTIFSIRFSRGYLLKWNEAVFSSYLKNARKELPTALCNHLPATGEMMFIIHELFRERPFPEMYRYKKVAELLRSAVERKGKSIRLNRTQVINQRDTFKLEQAKNHLEKHIGENAGTIEEISKSIGMNSQKLKQGFKKHYGTTIFGYITRLRMEKAKSLLLDSDLEVKKIASDVSYRHVSNFSYAFKKYFGHSPSTVRE